MGNSREKIIKAAAGVFAKEGYKGATTKRIAQEAGVNEATLFRIFSNKEKLFREVLAENSKMSTIIDILKTAEPSEPIEEKLIQVVNLFRHMYDSAPEATVIFHQCAIRDEDVGFMSKFFGVKAYGSLVAYLDLLLEKEKISLRTSPAEAAFYFLSMVHGSLERNMIFHEMDDGVNADLLVSVFLKGISAE